SAVGGSVLVLTTRTRRRRAVLGCGCGTTRGPRGRPRRSCRSPLRRLLGRRLPRAGRGLDRKSTRLNSSHVKSSYAVFCSKKNKIHHLTSPLREQQLLSTRHSAFYRD